MTRIALLFVVAVAGCSGASTPTAAPTVAPIPSATAATLAPTPTAAPTSTPTPGSTPMTEPSPTPGAPAGFVAYEAEDGSFSIALPDDWSGEGTAAEFVGTSALGSVTATVMFSDGFLVDSTLLDIAEAAKLGYGVRPGALPVELTESSVGSEPAWRLEAISDDGTFVSYFIADPADPEDMWELRFHTGADEPDPVFDEITETFTFGE